MTAVEAARQILQASAHGRSVVSITALAGAVAGERILIEDDGSVSGSFGSADADALALELGIRVLASRESHVSVDMFAEFHAPTEQLVIFGAGHIAVPLSEIAVTLGFSVTVLDDREAFAVENRFPRVACVERLDLADPLQNITITPHTFVVLVTRAHENDFDCLRVLLQHDIQPCYIGMIGSRRRVRAAFTALLAGGITRAQLERVHAPIGIDIGAETPSEIAVSIAAELIRVRRGGTANTLAGEERVLERFFAERHM